MRKKSRHNCHHQMQCNLFLQTLRRQKTIFNVHFPKAGQGCGAKKRDKSQLTQHTSSMQSKNINLTLSAYTNMKYAPLHLKRRSGHAVAERLIQSRSPNIKGPFVYCFYGPNNIMKRRPLYSETINNYRACLVSCCPDADREGRQTTRRHIKGSQ